MQKNIMDVLFILRKSSKLQEKLLETKMSEHPNLKGPGTDVRSDYNPLIVKFKIQLKKLLTNTKTK